MNTHPMRWFAPLLLHLLALLCWPLTVSGTTRRVVRDNGDVDLFDKQTSSPFTTYRRGLHNPGPADREVRGFSCAFQMPVEWPAKDFRILGVDGLNQGLTPTTSYLFLAVAKPDASAGTVAGWATQERGLLRVTPSAQANREVNRSVQAEHQPPCCHGTGKRGR